MMRRSGRYEHSVWDTRRYACAAAETVSLNGPGERAVLSCATQCLLRSGRAHGQYAAVTRLKQTAHTHRMPKRVWHGKGRDTHGQRGLVRYNMRTDGGVGPGADRRVGTAGASSVREHGPVCAAEHADARMHARTPRQADATRDGGCDDAARTGCVFGMEAD